MGFSCSVQNPCLITLVSFYKFVAVKKPFKMKYTLFFLIVFLSTSILHAQLTDDMESYTDGSLIFQDHWTDWNGTGDHALISSSTQAYEGSLSGYIPPNGTTDAILNLGNKTTGNWGLSFMMFVPSNREAQMNIQGVVPVSSGDWTVGNIFFNKDNNSPNTGYITYQSSNSSYWSFFNFPHDEWFEVVFNININNNWQVLINRHVEVDWTEYGKWVADGQFEYSNKLGGINFFSGSTICEYWIDNISFINGFFDATTAVSDYATGSGIAFYPNPTKGIVHLKNADDRLLNNTISVYSIVGALVLQQKPIDNTIDLSSLKKGVYILSMFDDKTQSTAKQKIVIE